MLSTVDQHGSLSKRLSIEFGIETNTKYLFWSKIAPKVAPRNLLKFVGVVKVAPKF
eukprot:COSAG05_NODE_182_length_14772_cov_42.430655_17_plen_56_part_00